MDFIETDDDRTYVVMDTDIFPDVRHFEENLTDFVKNDGRNLIIDLQHVTRLNSMLLAAFVRIKKNLAEGDRQFFLINPGENVLKLIEHAGLDTFLLD